MFLSAFILSLLFEFSTVNGIIHLPDKWHEARDKNSMFLKEATDGIGHTPLVELSRITPNSRVRILAKLEGQNLGGSASIKDRIVKYMLDKAISSGELTRDKTIIEATSGNTGIGLSWLGHRLGYKVVIIMPDSMSQERQRLIKLFGAELILTEGSLGMKGAIDTAYELATKNGKYYMPDQFRNPANPLTHYETTGVEIVNDFPYERIDALVAGIGTGGTIIGIGRRLKESYPATSIIGVEPPPGDAIQGLKCLESLDKLPPFMDLSLISQRARVTSQEAAAAARQLLRQEGIFAGMSSGAAIYQAVKVAREMDKGNIVVILPDGGWKYLSMDFWDEADS